MRLLKNDEQITDKTICELKQEIEQATLKLELLPTLLNGIIDNYNLYKTELSKKEKKKLSKAHDDIYDTLTLVSYELWETIEKLKEIRNKKRPKLN